MPLKHDGLSLSFGVSIGSMREHFAYIITSVLSNNVHALLSARPKCTSVPPSFPPDQSALGDAESPASKDPAFFDYNCYNLNIILSMTALVEGALEEALLEAYPHCVGESNQIAPASAILRRDIVKISSLDSYALYFKRVFQSNLRDVFGPTDFSTLEVLFQLRHMIIHSSALEGRVIRTDRHLWYLHVDDPWYLSLLQRCQGLMGLPSKHYLLPEQLLSWNSLTDALIEAVGRGAQRVMGFVTARGLSPRSLALYSCARFSRAANQHVEPTAGSVPLEG